MNFFLLPILAGLSIGFLGSFHCIGMCGPIALALPVQGQKGWQKYARIFLYNLGRGVTYATLGLLFGLVGAGFHLWGLQQIVTIVAGGMVLLILLSNYALTSRLKGMSTFHAWLRNSLGRLLQRPKGVFSFFSVGLLNGLLPCGLVYVAIAAALGTADMWKGALLMFAFGFGTFPVMAGMMLFGHLISGAVRHKLNRAVPVLVGVMAVALILRGMNLGIPFLSPRMDKDRTQVECSHHPS